MLLTVFEVSEGYIHESVLNYFINIIAIPTSGERVLQIMSPHKRVQQKDDVTVKFQSLDSGINK